MHARLAVPALLAAAVALGGCRIDTYECNKSCPGSACAGGFSGGGSSGSADADASCVPFCNRLEYCGLIKSGHFQDCIDHCEAAYAANPQQTESGCSCVVADYCRPPDGSNGDYVCPGAPLVTDGQLGADGGSGSTSGTSGTTGSSGSSGSTGSSSSGSSGTTGSGTACTRNLDCAIGADCVSGQCLTRCHASCECALNQVCGTDGYCRSEAPPQTACQADCDCPSGHACVNGWCN